MEKLANRLVTTRLADEVFGLGVAWEMYAVVTGRPTWSELACKRKALIPILMAVVLGHLVYYERNKNV